MDKIALILKRINYIKTRSNKSNGRKKSNFIKVRKTQLIYGLFIFTVFLGALIGAILANVIETDQFTEISSYLSKFISMLKTEDINKNTILIDTIIKHSKATVIIWFMAFIPYGVFVTELILFSKGLTCGFTTALLIREFGLDGILFGIASYVPQNILLLPMYIALSFYSINIFSKRKKFVTNKQMLSEHIMTFAVCFIITIFASLIETYISPYLMQKTIIQLAFLNVFL